MNQKYFIFVLSLFLCLSISAQKQYVWAPKEYTPSKRPNVMAKDTVYLSISDNRSFTKKTKVKCTSEELKNVLIELYRRVYPNAYFIYDDAFYTEECKNNSINIKVGIQKYSATFSWGTWTGWTTFDVYFCKRINNTNIDYTKSVSYYSSEANLLGYITGSACLKNAYKAAIDDMFDCIDFGFSTIKNQLELAKRSTLQSGITINPINPNNEKLVEPGVLSKIVKSNSKVKLDPKDIYKRRTNAVFMIFTSDGEQAAQGSGFFISKDGIAISNYHVFKDTYKGLEVIKTVDGNKYKIKEVLGYSEKYDYIVFQIDGDSFDYIPVSTHGIEIGDEVYAIGSPMGFENTISSGLISQKHRDFLYQISVPIDHGSSGGALINKYGEAIGITTGDIDVSTANLNFALDIKVIFNEKF